jgi:hypothetical protein
MGLLYICEQTPIYKDIKLYHIVGTSKIKMEKTIFCKDLPFVQKLEKRL